MAASRAQPRTQAAPSRKKKEEHSDWTHGPVAAAVNVSLVMALLAVLVRVTHLPPGLPLLIGVVLAVALVIAGKARKPRPLAGRSLMYRATAMFSAGVWLWAQTADFTKVGPQIGVAVVLTTCGLAAAGGAVTAHQHGVKPLTLLVGGAAAVLTITGGALAVQAHVAAIVFDATPIDKHVFLRWLLYALVSLAVLATFFAIIGKACANHEAELDDQFQRALLMRSGGKRMLELQRLLREVTRATHLTVVPSGFQQWANNAGESYEIDGSQDGLTPPDVSRYADALASRMNLPLGCGVEAVTGATRGRIRVDVSRVNRIKDSVVYPPMYVQRSIYNGLPVGILRDGSEVNVMLRESSAFVFGQKRSGKTTTLYDIAAGILQCTDALLWVIDFGGGGVALPYLYPYADGRCKTPAVDWVATTVEEAKMMSDLALAIALDRKVFYKHRKRKGNTNLLPLDSEVPEIIVMIDEGAEAMGASSTMSYEAQEVRATLEKIVRVAGDSGVNIVFSGLSATQEVIDRMTLSQLAIRIGMRVTDGRELAYGFNNDYKLNPDDIPYQGSGFVKPDHETPTRVFKAYLLEPDQMAEIAIATEAWRPRLDDRGLQLGGSVYAERWKRTAHLLTDENGNLLIDPDAQGGTTAVAVMERPDPADGPGSSPASGTAPTDGQLPAPSAAGGRPPRPTDVDINEGLRPIPVQGSPDDVMRRADETARQLSDAAAAAGGDLSDDAVDERFEQIMGSQQMNWSDPSTWKMPPPPSSMESASNPHGPKVLEALVRHHGMQGIAAKDLKDRLRLGGVWGPPVPVSDVTIHAWLKPGGQPVGWLALRGRGEPYVHRDCAMPGANSG